MTKFDLGRKLSKGQVLGLAGSLKGQVLVQEDLLVTRKDHLLNLVHLMRPEVWTTWIGLDHVALRMHGQGLVMIEDHFQVARIEDFWVTESLTGQVQGKDGEQRDGVDSSCVQLLTS